MNVIIKKSRFYKSAKRNRDGRETGAGGSGGHPF